MSLNSSLELKRPPDPDRTGLMVCKMIFKSSHVECDAPAAPLLS